MVKKEKRTISIARVLRYLGVSRSGYNSWSRRKPSKNQKRKESICEVMKKIYDESKQNSGSPKITKELHKKGIKYLKEQLVNICVKWG